MPLSNTPIYMSSILLERNRFNGKGPSLLVSEWVEFIAEAGFQGVEVWAPHLLLSSRSEWELIREKSQESDLPITSLLAQIPTDLSTKSRRQRDFLIEAADYFTPQSLRFSLAEGSGSEEDRLGFLGEWMADLPRELLLVRAFEGMPFGSKFLAKHREKLGPRLRCSINPFSLKPNQIETWLTQEEGKVSNLAIRIQSKGKSVALRDEEEACVERVAVLRELDFQGSWIMESTQGVGAPGEDIEDLFDEAEEDLNFLIAALGRA